MQYNRSGKHIKLRHHRVQETSCSLYQDMEIACPIVVDYGQQLKY
jgi:hypothetical protein